MAVFEGAGVALITPFKENGEVNYEKLEELVEEQIAGGTDAIIACGTTGEASTMSHEEHLDVIRFVCEKVKGRLPVVAGTGSNCTETAVYLSEEAEKLGADAVLQVSPYYNKATQKGLYKHFAAVAEAIRIPVILYNIPGRTGTQRAARGQHRGRGPRACRRSTTACHRSRCRRVFRTQTARLRSRRRGRRHS